MLFIVQFTVNGHDYIVTRDGALYEINTSGHPDPRHWVYKLVVMLG